MQQNHRANVWITPETRANLVPIGRAHGAAKGRELSAGIRVAAGFHGRLVEVLNDCLIEIWDLEKEASFQYGKESELDDMPESYLKARALLKEIEEAR